MTGSTGGERDPLLGGEHNEALGGEQIATYREIAACWRLKGWEEGDGVDAARVKAKRAGWRQLPRNHPADPVRVAIPRATWDAATATGGRAALTDSHARRNNAIPHSKQNAIPESRIASVLASLDEHWELARSARESLEQALAEAAAAREEARQAQAELATERSLTAEVREALRQAQGEVDGMKLGLEHMHEVLAQARREAAETGAKAE